MFKRRALPPTARVPTPAHLRPAGKFNQLGFGNDEDLLAPAALPPLKGSTAALACGALHTLALAHGGRVLSWGANQVRVVRWGAGGVGAWWSWRPEAGPGQQG